MQPLSKTDALAAVPAAVPHIRLKVTEQGFVRITYPATLPGWIARFVPAGISPGLRTLELDAMGSHVWALIDGRTTVRGLAEKVAGRYGVHQAEAEQAVAAFIRQLGRRGILILREAESDGA